MLLEHVNVTIPDQRLATIFYVAGLGLTRDPYLMAGVENMWVNVGRSQFHLPSRGAQVLRGHVGIVHARSRRRLKRRLQKVAPLLAETRFAWEERDGVVEATCPWGNRYRCHAPAPEFGDTELAIAYVEFDVPRGAARRHRAFLRGHHGGARRGWRRGAERRRRRFHQRHAAAALPRNRRARCRSTTGTTSRSTSPISPGPHRRLLERGLITEESNEYQYRFRDIVDPDDAASRSSPSSTK